MAKDESSLKRLGGGRWETRDGRFAIEPQSGSWVIVDSEQTDELGLPLVRGPYPSLTAAKEAIAEARTGEPAESPLARRLDEAAAERTTGKATHRRKGGRTNGARKAAPEPPPPPPEPRWLTDLDAGDRRRAREWIARLETAGISEAEAIARDEVARGRPAVVRTVLQRRLADLVGRVEGGAQRAAVREAIEALVDGSERDLGVRWRLVDGDGRAVGALDLPD